jgi:ferric-dicitrate binding protein FerR (iron transport regulator)
VEDAVSERDEDKSEPLRGEFDLDAWDAESPPVDFAERVLARVREEAKPSKAPPRRSAARAWGIAGGAVATLALAAAIVLKVGAPASHGEAHATARTEVAIGARAVAVLEPGADVSWDGDDVQQPHGDVFYRVEKGARFRVHTPAGDVEVKGTCFTVKVSDMQKRDIKSGGVGAALTALAFVAVYEGKVAVSHAGERVDLAAGETAQAGVDGVHKSGDLGEGQKTFDAKLAAAAENNPLAQANENLVLQVAEYRKRLEAIAQQKSELEEKLKKSEEKLAHVDGGGSARNRSEYDLDKDDWAQLARDGNVKYRVPCMRPDLWSFDNDRLASLGLAPSDGPALRDAYQKSYDRMWSQIRPMCIAELGTPPDIVDKIGPSTCPHLIYDIESAKNKEATAEAHTQAAEIRAGLRPEPGPNEKVHPVLRMFLLLTSANGSFESDLAKTFGPDQAHQMAFSDSKMCNWNSTWGGGKKRGEDKK